MLSSQFNVTVLRMVPKKLRQEIDTRVDTSTKAPKREHESYKLFAREDQHRQPLT